MQSWYRRGELDSCERAWDDLWACVRARRVAREGAHASSASTRAETRTEVTGGDATAYWRALDATRAGREWRALFRENVPSEREMADATAAWTRSSAGADGGNGEGGG